MSEEAEPALHFEPVGLAWSKEVVAHTDVIVAGIFARTTNLLVLQQTFLKMQALSSMLGQAWSNCCSLRLYSIVFVAQTLSQRISLIVL